MKKKILSFCAIIALVLSVSTSTMACGDWWNADQMECRATGESYCANDCPEL